MWPTLVSIGPLSIHSFGVVLFLGLFFGGFKLWQKAREEGWDETAVMDGWLLSGVGALLAGRFGYILLHLNDFGGSWYKMIFFTKFPGLSGEVAWLGGVLVLLLWGFVRKFNWWRWLEAMVPALILVEMMTHLAAGLAGGNWLIQFSWALGLILVYCLLVFWEKRYRAFNLKEGVIVAAYLLFAGGLTIGLGWWDEQLFQWWGAGKALAGGLILGFRSGITIKASVNKQPSRKKRGFDYV